MAPNTAPAGKSYAQKAADLFMSAVGMKSAPKPEPKEDVFAQEKLNPVASANLLAERCRHIFQTVMSKRFVKHSGMQTRRI